MATHEPTGDGTPTKARAKSRPKSPAAEDDQLGQSFAAAVRAVRSSPESEDGWEHVEELAATVQRPDEVAAAYRDVLDGQLTRVLRDRLSRRAVRFQDEWFGDDPQAMDGLLSAIIERDSEATWAFERFTVALTVAERWDDLLGLYDRVLDVTTDKVRRQQLLDDAAHVAKDFAHDAPRAVDYMLKRLDLDVDNEKLIANIERLLERQERWNDLIALWQERLTRLSPTATRQSRLQIAQTYLDHLQRVEPALAELQIVLDESPGHADGCTLLERVLAWETAPPAIRNTALALLRTNYEAANRPADVVSAVEQALGFAAPTEVLALHREAGARLAILGRDEEALRHYTALLRKEPTDADARRQLRQIARRSNLVAEQAAGLVHAADVADPAQQAALLMEAAHLHRQQLDDAPEAIALYRRVLDLAEADRSLALSAGHHLSELLAQAERDQERLAVLECLADLESADAVRRAVLGEAGRLADALGEPDRALGAYAHRLQTDPKDLDALDASIDVLHRCGRWEALIEALRRRADISLVPQQRRADLIRIAQIQVDELEAIGDGIETWLQVRKEFGDEVDTITALDRLMPMAMRWPELAELLDTAAGVRRGRSATLLRRLGQIHHEQLGEPEKATRYWAQNLGVEPSDPDARKGLLELAENHACSAEAVTALVAAYRATADWQSLLALLELRLAAADSARASVEVLRESAALQEHRAGDREAAQTSIARALVLDPDATGLEHELLRLAEVTGGWSAAAQAFSDAAEAARVPARAADLRRREGQIREEQLEDATGTVRAYASAATADPSDLATRRAVIRASALAGTWPEAATAAVAVCLARELLDRDAIGSLSAAAGVRDGWTALCSAFETALREATLPATLGRDLQAELARWHLEQREDLAAAEAAAARAVEHTPDHAPSLRLLAEIQRKRPLTDDGQRPPLTQTLLRLDTLVDRDLDALDEAAKVALQAQADEAWTHDVVARLYRKASRLFSQAEEVVGDRRPGETALWALEQLVSMDLAAGRSDAAIRILLAASELPLPREQTLDLRVRAAALCVEAGSRQKAIDLYRNVLAERPDDLELVRTLADLCEQENRVLELVRARTRELDLTGDVERRLELRLALSGLVGELERQGGRVDSLRSNLGEHPGHRPSVEALTVILTDKGRHDQLADVLTEQAQQLETSDAARSAELWSAVAQLVEERFDDTDRAIAALQRVVGLAATGEALDTLARLHLHKHEPAEAATVLERRLSMTEEAMRTPVLLRLARAQLQAEQSTPAIATLEAAFQLAPRSGEVRKLLLDLYRAHELWAPLAAALSVATEHVTDNETILAYAREASELFHGRLRRPEQAVPVLERAHTLAPDDREIKSRLAEGLLAEGRLGEARTLIEGLVADFGRRRSPERAAAHLQLARVAHAQGEVDEAIDQLELASGMDASNPTILRTLAETAREAGQLERAERSYRALLMQVRRRTPADSREEIGAAEVLYQLSLLAAERGDQDLADELVESVLEALTDNDDEGPRLQDLLRRTGDMKLLQRVLDTRLRHAENPRRRAEVLGEIADLQQTHLKQPKAALQSRLAALEADPASSDSHDRARALATELGQLDAYVDLLDTLLERARRNTDIYVRCELLLRLAESMERDREDHVRATELVQQAEELGVREVDVWRAAARLAGVRGDREQQLAYLERLTSLGVAEGETRADALYRVAEVYLAAEDTLARGMDVMQEALELDPRWERACRVLARASEGEVGNAELLALYDRAARKTGDAESLLQAIERRAAHPDTAPEDVREGVELAERLLEADRGEALMLRAVELAGGLLDGDQRIGWALRGLAQRRKSAGDLAGAVKWLCEAIQTGDPSDLFGMARQVVDLGTVEGGDLTLAVQVYEALFERDPSVRDAWEPLADLYRRLGDVDKLQRLVEETLDGLDDATERNALRLQLAQSLMQRPGRESEAMETLRNILLEKPDDDVAQRLLVDLIERSGSDDDLIDLLNHQLMTAQQRQDAQGVATAAMRLSQRQTDPADALATLSTAMEWAPDHPELLHAVRDRLTDPDRAGDRIRITERLIELERGDAAATLTLELADGYAAAGDREAELQALMRGYRRAPSHEKMRHRLEQAYELRGDYRGLADMLALAAKGEPDPVNRVIILRQAATIQRELLSDAAASAAILEQAHAALPDDADLALDLASTLASAGQLSRAMTLVSALLDRVDLDDNARLGLLSTRADLRAATKDVAGTVEDLEVAVTLDPAAIAPRLAEALERQRSAAAAAEDAEAERAATLRLCEVSLLQSDRERVREVLGAWVERQRKDVEALRMLRDVDAADERWESVARTCGRLVAVESDEAQVEAALQLAHACRELGKPGDARPGLEHARRKQPDDPEILQALRHIYEETGADRELAKLLVADAEQASDPDERLVLLRRVADLFIKEGDIESALPIVAQVLELVPGDPAATVSLADVHLALGHTDEADAILDAAIADSKSRRSPELAMLYHRKAQVCAAAGDPHNQLAVLQQAFAVDKNNGQVAADLADLAEALEQWDLAVRVLRTITLIDADCPISRVQAFLRQAQIALRRGDRQRAVLWARKARHEGPDDTDVVAFLASLGE